MPTNIVTTGQVSSILSAASLISTIDASGTVDSPIKASSTGMITTETDSTISTGETRSLSPVLTTYYLPADASLTDRSTSINPTTGEQISALLSTTPTETPTLDTRTSHDIMTPSVVRPSTIKYVVTPISSVEISLATSNTASSDVSSATPEPTTLQMLDQSSTGVVTATNADTTEPIFTTQSVTTILTSLQHTSSMGPPSIETLTSKVQSTEWSMNSYIVTPGTAFPNQPSTAVFTTHHMPPKSQSISETVTQDIAYITDSITSNEFFMTQLSTTVLTPHQSSSTETLTSMLQSTKGSMTSDAVKTGTFIPTQQVSTVSPIQQRLSLGTSSTADSTSMKIISDISTSNLHSSMSSTIASSTPNTMASHIFTAGSIYVTQTTHLLSTIKQIVYMQPKFPAESTSENAVSDQGTYVIQPSTRTTFQNSSDYSSVALAISPTTLDLNSSEASTTVSHVTTEDTLNSTTKSLTSAIISIDIVTAGSVFTAQSSIYDLITKHELSSSSTTKSTTTSSTNNDISLAVRLSTAPELFSTMESSTPVVTADVIITRQPSTSFFTSEQKTYFGLTSTAELISRFPNTDYFSSAINLFPTPVKSSSTFITPTRETNAIVFPILTTSEIQTTYMSTSEYTSPIHLSTEVWLSQTDPTTDGSNTLFHSPPPFLSKVIVSATYSVTTNIAMTSDYTSAIDMSTLMYETLSEIGSDISSSNLFIPSDTNSDVYIPDSSTTNIVTTPATVTSHSQHLSDGMSTAEMSSPFVNSTTYNKSTTIVQSSTQFLGTSTVRLSTPEELMTTMFAIISTPSGESSIAAFTTEQTSQGGLATATLIKTDAPSTDMADMFSITSMMQHSTVETFSTSKRISDTFSTEITQSPFSVYTIVRESSIDTPSLATLVPISDRTTLLLSLNTKPTAPETNTMNIVTSQSPSGHISHSELSSTGSSTSANHTNGVSGTGIYSSTLITSVSVHSPHTFTVDDSASDTDLPVHSAGLVYATEYESSMRQSPTAWSRSTNSTTDKPIALLPSSIPVLEYTTLKSSTLNTTWNIFTTGLPPTLPSHAHDNSKATLAVQSTHASKTSPYTGYTDQAGTEIMSSALASDPLYTATRHLEVTLSQMLHTDDAFRSGASETMQLSQLQGSAFPTIVPTSNVAASTFHSSNPEITSASTGNKIRCDS